jgi:hypothetical protein
MSVNDYADQVGVPSFALRMVCSARKKTGEGRVERERNAGCSAKEAQVQFSGQC